MLLEAVVAGGIIAFLYAYLASQADKEQPYFRVLFTSMALIMGLFVFWLVMISNNAVVMTKTSQIGMDTITTQNESISESVSGGTGIAFYGSSVVLAIYLFLTAFGLAVMAFTQRKDKKTGADAWKSVGGQ